MDRRLRWVLESRHERWDGGDRDCRVLTAWKAPGTGPRGGSPTSTTPWLGVRRCAVAISSLAALELDLAETAVIQLAIELQAKLVAIDEWKGRRAALALNLAVTGSLGLLGKAKKLGLVDAVRPLVERATAAGVRYHPAVVSAVLRELGEERGA